MRISDWSSDVCSSDLVPANATKDEMIALLNQAVNEVVAAAGCSIINPVVVATTDNIPLFGVQTIDDVTVIPDDRVLVKNQNSGSENGIYVAAAGAWSQIGRAHV